MISLPDAIYMQMLKTSISPGSHTEKKSGTLNRQFTGNKTDSSLATSDNVFSMTRLPR